MMTRCAVALAAVAVQLPVDARFEPKERKVLLHVCQLRAIGQGGKKHSQSPRPHQKILEMFPHLSQ